MPNLHQSKPDQPKQHPKPDQRHDLLRSRQQLKMAESAHAYVRGNTLRFYQWLASDAVKATLPQGPPVWICGDCHTGNLGPLADAEGQIDVQIRDLDQTVIGNPAHDLLRLGLSLAMAARSSDLPGVTTALMIEEMIVGYLLRLTGHSAGIEPEEIAPICRVMRTARHRRWKHLAEERIEDVRPEIPIGKRYLKLEGEEKKELERFFKQKDAGPLVACLGGPDEVRHMKLVDAAYWIKGCSSLGRLRYAALVDVELMTGKREYRLLDVKEATHAAAPCAETGDMPKDEAERVVCGARALSPNLGQRMVATRLGKRPVVVRELRPGDMKFELVNLKQDQAIGIARLMAGVVGRAHGRQMSKEDRRAWAKGLRSRHGKGLDAPRWLWSGVLDLAALHEAAYLEHCRSYALGVKQD